MACTNWRGIAERFDWMLNHPPGTAGWCAREVWQALGGDANPPCPPAWGTSDANEVYDNVVNSGRYWTTTPIPVGAIIVWKYGENGHVAYSYYDNKILTTDPSGNPGGVGVENLDYPQKWGASSSKRIWTDQYNGVRFSVGAEVEAGEVYLSKLKYGQKDSDSVRRLQDVLNKHPLSGGEPLPITGNYLDETDEEVRLCQEQHGFGADPVNESFVGEAQAEHLFAGSGHTVINDIEPEEPEEPEEPPVENPSTTGILLDKWYSGKPSGTFTLPSDGDWHKLDLSEPDRGITTDSSEHRLLYLRVELDKTRSANKLLEIKFVRKNGDDTAYDSEEFSLIKDSYPYRNVHIEDGPGDGGSWWAKSTGGTSPMKFTTRYAKLHTFYEAP